jgi:hypothetical protein
VTPLTDAVRFVDGEQIDFDLVARFQKRFVSEPFRCYVKDVVGSFTEGCSSRGTFSIGECGIDKAGANPLLLEIFYLILHQGNQGRKNDCGPFSNQGRNLVAERFAAAGRHHHHGVFSGNEAVNNLLLNATEGLQSETFFKNPLNLITKGLWEAWTPPIATSSTATTASAARFAFPS